jgi:Zn ribbon nucleic-acid-binding protein
MASVLDYIECPNCEQEAFSDFYYKTGEEYVNCNNCGYHYSATIKDRTKSLNELDEDDFEIVELKNPFGAYRIKFYDSPGYTCGSLESEEQLNELKSELEESIHAGIEIEYFQVSRFIDGQIKVETIIDNGPKTDSAGFTAEDRFEGDDEEEYFI